MQALGVIGLDGATTTAPPKRTQAQRRKPLVNVARQPGGATPSTIKNVAVRTIHGGDAGDLLGTVRLCLGDAGVGQRGRSIR